VQHEAEAAEEIQRQKAEISKLQEELRTMKAKQSLSFNQPSPEYVLPNQSTFTEGNTPFTQPPPYTTFSHNPFVNPFESGPSNHNVHTICTRSWDPKSPLSQEIQITPWPQSYRPVPLPRFSLQSDPRQFLMSYEASILSAGGDDSVLVKSFIIAADEAAAQWYSLLSLSVIHRWDDLKQWILSKFKVSNVRSLQRAIFSLVSKRIRKLSRTTSGDSSTSEPKHQMCWTSLPSTLCSEHGLICH
jgi:hypothetical protein